MLLWYTIWEQGRRQSRPICHWCFLKPEVQHGFPAHSFSLVSVLFTKVNSRTRFGRFHHSATEWLLLSLETGEPHEPRKCSRRDVSSRSQSPCRRHRHRSG